MDKSEVPLPINFSQQFFSEVFQEHTFTLFSVYYKTNTECFIGPDNEFFFNRLESSISQSS